MFYHTPKGASIMKQLINTSLKAGSLFIIFVLILATGCQQQKPDASKELKPIVDKFIEVWNNGNFETLDALLDPGVVRTVNHIPDVEGIAGMKEVMNGFRTAFPDVKLAIDNEIYADNLAAFRWTFSGTNTGPGQMSPTGKSVNIWGITILHFANGKLTKEIVSYDDKVFMEQLGFTMAPPPEETN